MKEEANLLAYNQFQVSLISHFVYSYFEKHFNVLPLIPNFRNTVHEKIKFNDFSPLICI